MTKNLIPLLLILLLLRNRSGHRPPLINTLELEALLDNARNALNTLDRVNGLAHTNLTDGLSGLTALVGGSGGGLPDMKKIMEIVEKLPL